MRLLVVDDDPDFAALIVASAPSWLRVSECASSEETIRMLERPGRERFDMALIDMDMRAHLDTLSEHEGLALARWMRRHGETQPLIIVSGHVDPALLSGASSVTGFLRKPVNLDRVYRFLKAYVDLFEIQDNSLEAES